MATNWPQQLNPRAWRSARCSTTARSNSVRENSCNIWLKMLDTRITAAVVLLAVTSLNATVTELYRRCSNANLDKSECHYENCGAVLSVPIDKLDTRRLHKCPHCERPWLEHALGSVWEKSITDFALSTTDM